MLEKERIHAPLEKKPSERSQGASSAPFAQQAHEPDWKEQRRILWQSRQDSGYRKPRRRWHPLREPPDSPNLKHNIAEALAGGGSVDPAKQAQIRSLVGTEAWGSLTPYQREILSARYLNDDPPRLGHLAERLGITRQGVKMVEDRAYRALAGRQPETVGFTLREKDHDR